MVADLRLVPVEMFAQRSELTSLLSEYLSWGYQGDLTSRFITVQRERDMFYQLLVIRRVTAVFPEARHRKCGVLNFQRGPFPTTGVSISCVYWTRG